MAATWATLGVVRSDLQMLPTDELGRALVAGRQRIWVAECEWLAQLAEFDRRGGFAIYGHLTTIGWLVDKCGLARATAKDKLRVAHELQRRPLLAVAFGRGELSYSKVRALTRITEVDAETDEALLDAARAGTAADLDRLARHWELLNDQDRPPDERARWERRGLRRYQRYDGMAVIEIVLAADDAERLVAVIDAYLERLRGAPTNRPEPDIPESADEPPVDEASGSHRRSAGPAHLEPTTRRRAHGPHPRGPRASGR